MSFANKLSEMRNCSATLQHKEKRDKGHQVWQTLLTIHAEMPPLEPRGTLETVLPQQKYCTKGKLPTAGAGPVGPVSVQLGPGAELDEPRGCTGPASGFSPAQCHGGNTQPFTCLSPASDILRDIRDKDNAWSRTNSGIYSLPQGGVCPALIPILT